MTWHDLLRLEPRLAHAHRLAEDAHNDALQWADFHHQLHPVLRPLVGFGAAEATLRTTAAYNVAVQYLTSVWRHGVQRQTTPITRPWNGPNSWDVDDAAEKTTAEPAEPVAV